MATKRDVQIIRISIKAFDHRLLDEAVSKIVNVAKDSGAVVV
jgi:ribosomal protein S10